MGYRKNWVIYICIMVFFAFIILLNFGIHIKRTKEFNQQIINIDETNNQENDITFSFYPQHNNEISWTRTVNMNSNSVEMNACSYEGLFTNHSKVEISNWTMRLDFIEECYLNSSWNGIVEVHQNVDGEEKIQKIDLRYTDESDLTLEYIEDGDIFLFPMSKGDYLIYYPNKYAKEIPIVAIDDVPGKVGIGFIIYWDKSKPFVQPRYKIEYQRHKKYFKGTEATIFIITGILWIISIVTGLAVYVTTYMSKEKIRKEIEKRESEKKITEKMLDELIKALAYSIDVKDKYTHGHSERVAAYSLKLAKLMNLPHKDCKEIFYAGLVHDVGKIGIPEKIINKQGKLTDVEYEIIKTHTENGAGILKHITDMPYLAIGAKYHHERYDGKGYPCHLKGDEISLLARIVAVADSYDAMTSHRSYRDMLSQKEVREEIVNGMGTQFDPVVAQKMIMLIDEDKDFSMRQKQDENYVLIDEIKTEEYWEGYYPVEEVYEN